MRKLRFLSLPCMASLMVAVANPVSAQSFPTKPIRVVTSGVGGGIDVIVRMTTPGLAVSMGQQVIVDNRASGVTPGSIVSKAPPDGYTLLAYGGTFWIGSLLTNTLPYDVVRDFAPITWAAGSPNLIVVNPALPVKSVKELIALAKAKPGELNYASSGTGSSGHLAAELFNSMAGVNIVRIPYKSSGQAVSDTAAGQVQVMFPNAPAVAPFIKSGKLRVLAVTSAQPSALFPGLPTAAASGLPGYESGAKFGFFAPAKTPVQLVNRLNQEVVRALNQPAIKERLFNTGLEVVGNSPESFAAVIKSEMARLGKVIRDAGIHEEN